MCLTLSRACVRACVRVWVHLLLAALSPLRRSYIHFFSKIGAAKDDNKGADNAHAAAKPAARQTRWGGPDNALFCGRWCRHGQTMGLLRWRTQRGPCNRDVL